MVAAQALASCVQIPASLLICSVAFCKLPDHAKPPFSHLKCEDSKIRGLNEMMSAFSAEELAHKCSRNAMCSFLPFPDLITTIILK